MNSEITDPVMGHLVHDGHYYNGTCAHGQIQFEFSIGTYEVADVASRLEKARGIHGSIASLIQQATAYAALRLLPLKNDTWEEEDGRVISQEEFEHRLIISSVTLDHNGRLVIYFDDGDLFFGHDILVTQDIDGEFDTAGIQG